VLHKESLIVSPFEYRVVLPHRDLFRLKIAETDIGIDGLPWNVDIETSPGTADPGSNPARVYVFRESIAMMLCRYVCIIDLKCNVYLRNG
jgi:hypothetical protein